MLGSAAASAIGLYQRYVSPYKGFCCAYRAQTGRRSCSAYGKAVATRLGFVALFQALPRQFGRCRTSFVALAGATLVRQLNAKTNAKSQAKNDQRNGKRECDPFDACDVVDLATNVEWGGCDLPCDCSF
jgi:putative component of membrane protein insertase Oxa1/YidC/SpoIIIJ protein YidD